jgi:hypothetical protein
MRNVATRLTKADLIIVLDDIRAAILADDSFDGSFDYTAGGFDETQATLTYDVRAAYRIGNSTGQGGLIVIGELNESGR